jgi:hypothetical protein
LRQYCMLYYHNLITIKVGHMSCERQTCHIYSFHFKSRGPYMHARSCRRDSSINLDILYFSIHIQAAHISIHAHCTQPVTMAPSFFPELLISFSVIFLVVALYIKSSTRKNSFLPMKWPIFGLFPSLVSNLHRFHDFIALDILASSQYTFQACIASMSFFMTTQRIFSISLPQTMQTIPKVRSLQTSSMW